MPNTALFQQSLRPLTRSKPTTSFTALTLSQSQRHISTDLSYTSTSPSPTMTTSTFKYLNRSSIQPTTKPWAKVDGPGTSFTLSDHTKPVTDLRSVPNPNTFTTDTSGFSVHHAPSTETLFTDDTAIRTGYYDEVTNLLKTSLPGVSKVVIFDHTIRRHDPTSPRQPVQQVHVDQTPRAAEARVRRHLPPQEADDLLKRRYQIINVWRPIGHPASDYPLALVDWRSTQPRDFVKVDLMYPKRDAAADDAAAAAATNGVNGTASADDSDDRGKEVLPSPSSKDSTVGYEVKGETLVVAPNDSHQFYYVKDMTPEEAMFIKCFDSRSVWMNDEGYVSGEEGEAKVQEGTVQGKGEGRDGVAMGTAHTAFIDPKTPKGSKGRESIEVRCLVFYEEGA